MKGRNILALTGMAIAVLSVSAAGANGGATTIKKAPISVVLVGPVGEIADTNGSYIIAIGARKKDNGPISRVRVVEYMPRGSTPVKGNPRYKLVHGRPTWIRKHVTYQGQDIRFTLHWPANMKVGSRVCNVVKAYLVGKASRPATGHWCGEVSPPNP